MTELLTLKVATGFVVTGAGRILQVNAPDRAPGPRFYLAGCPSGNVVRLRHDVGAATARAIETLVATEPALCDPKRMALHLDRYLELLGRTIRRSSAAEDEKGTADPPRLIVP
jgi:hypothetical protein